jgi:hypothetical protein
MMTKDKLRAELLANMKKPEEEEQVAAAHGGHAEAAAGPGLFCIR